MTTRIYRYEVPVDDQVHTHALLGDPLSVGCRDPRVVEFWAHHVDGNGAGVERRFLVVGTGHPLPEDYWRHWGAVNPHAGPLVWHLIELTPTRDSHRVSRDVVIGPD